MKNQFLFSAFLSVLFIMISGCTEETVQPNPEDNRDNLMPAATGNYWVYNHYTLDTSQNKINSQNPNYDSTVIVGTVTIMAKTSWEYEDHSFDTNNTDTKDTVYYYKDGEKIYASEEIFNSILSFRKFGVDLPFEIPKQWLLFIDPSAKSDWQIYEAEYDSIEVVYMAITAYITGTLTIKGRYAGTESISINNVSHKAHKFSYMISFTGKVENPFIPVPMQNVAFSEELNFWFVNNIGLVKRQYKSFHLPIPTFDYDYPGSQNECIRYSVSK